jgi:hypothetical protein
VYRAAPGRRCGGKPPDEPAILGVALNQVFVPILQKQFPEIVDFYLPPEGCSYRMAIISIKKAYPGHAKRVMFGLWSFLHQLPYTKFIVVTDDDVDIRRWSEVIWAITTRMDPRRSAPCDPGHPKQRGQEMAAGLENTAQSLARLPYRRGAKDGPTLNGVRAIPKRGLLGAGCCPERLPTHEGVAGLVCSHCLITQPRGSRITGRFSRALSGFSRGGN